MARLSQPFLRRRAVGVLRDATDSVKRHVCATRIKTYFSCEPPNRIVSVLETFEFSFNYLLLPADIHLP